MNDIIKFLLFIGAVAIFWVSPMAFVILTVMMIVYSCGGPTETQETFNR